MEGATKKKRKIYGRFKICPRLLAGRVRYALAEILDLFCLLMDLHRWIKTDCGRAKLADLAARPGVFARLRLVWFVLIAAIRDWPLANPD